MKKLFLLSSLVLLSITFSFSQTSAGNQGAENEKLNATLAKKEVIISEQTDNIKKLDSELLYLKETLDLLNTEFTKESDNIIYKINSVKGNSSQGTITIEGLVENKGAISRLQAKTTDIFDPKGNQYSTHRRLFGKASSIPKFQKDIPTKFTITFDKIVEEAPILKAFIMEFYNKKNIIIFKNLPITWEQ